MKWRFPAALAIYFIPQFVVATAVTQNFYEQATQAFRSSQYEKALDLFLQAQLAGMDNSRIQYNLGMTFYKLGRYKKAVEALQNAAQDPLLASMAHINMGLAYYQLQQNEIAEDHINVALDAAKNENQRRLAQRLLGRMGRPGKKRWWGITRFNMGYNDNVILQEKDIELGSKLDQKDAFSSLFSQWKRPTQQNNQLDISLYHIQYQELNERHFSQFNTRYTHGLGAVALSAQAGRTLIGGTGLLSQAVLRMEFNQLARERFIYPYIAIYHFFNVSESYQYLKGAMQRLGLGRKWETRRILLNIDVQYEYNDRSNISNAGKLVQDFSPQRFGFTIRNEWRLNWMTMAFSLAYRQSEYKKPELVLPNPEFNRRRHDRRYFFQYQVYYPMKKHWWLFVKWHRLANQSNINDFSYQSDLSALGFLWRY